VDAVIDEFDGDVLGLGRSEDRPRGAVVDAGHRIERVGEDARPSVERLRRQLVVGGSVTDGHAHPCRRESSDRIEGTGKLGCDGDLRESSIGRLEDRFDRLRGRRSEHLGCVRALEVRRQERTFGVQTHDHRPIADETCARAQRPAQPLDRV
jgi:hypothetical protein